MQCNLKIFENTKYSYIVKGMIIMTDILLKKKLSMYTVCEFHELQ